MRVWSAIGTLAVMALAACGGSDSQPSEAAATGATSQTGPAATAVVEETAQPPPGGPAPPELQGTWLFRSESLGPVRLNITEDRYAVSAGGRSTQGDLVVDGDEIAFFNSNVCPLELPEGIGRYRWSITDEKLRLKLLGKDPCSGRERWVNSAFEREG